MVIKAEHDCQPSVSYPSGSIASASTSSSELHHKISHYSHPPPQPSSSRSHTQTGSASCGYSFTPGPAAFPLDPTFDNLDFRTHCPTGISPNSSSSSHRQQTGQIHPDSLSLFDTPPSLSNPSPSPRRSHHQPYSSFAPPANTSSSSLKNPGLDWLDSLFDPSGSGFSAAFDCAHPGGSGGLGGGGVGGGGIGGFVSDQAQLLSLESPEHLLANAMNGIPGTGINGAGVGNNATSGFSPLDFSINPATPSTSLGGIRNNSVPTLPNLPSLLNPIKREPQLEDVTSWANISHFIALFLQYLYPLLPLVHRPTFAGHLATRRDLGDMDFRALLLSIDIFKLIRSVAYVISQLPTSRLVDDQFDIEGLKRLQRKCHRTCKALQRTYYGPTNLTQITTIIFDMFYLLSIGLGHTAGARLGQAIQLAFSMGLHNDDKTNVMGLDAIEVQLRRRVFWQLYASDKSRAIPGPPMLINDYQGVPPLPEPIDDDFLTSQGMFPQPPYSTSVLEGFVCLSKIFRILSECFFHHRLVLSLLASGVSGGLPVPTVGTEWTVIAENRLHAVLREMPAAIQNPGVCANEKGRSVFAMQRANILITAAIAKFALYDLRAALHVDEDQLAKEREANAREIHSLLMKAKVFHIACALCTHTGATVADQELIRDWCNMFSAISFVQMPPPPHASEVFESRTNSPPTLERGTGVPEDHSTGAVIGRAKATQPGTVRSN